MTFRCVIGAVDDWHQGQKHVNSHASECELNVATVQRTQRDAEKKLNCRNTAKPGTVFVFGFNHRWTRTDRDAEWRGLMPHGFGVRL